MGRVGASSYVGHARLRRRQWTPGRGRLLVGNIVGFWRRNADVSTARGTGRLCSSSRSPRCCCSRPAAAAIAPRPRAQGRGRRWPNCGSSERLIKSTLPPSPSTRRRAAEPDTTGPPSLSTEKRSPNTAAAVAEHGEEVAEHGAAVAEHGEVAEHGAAVAEHGEAADQDAATAHEVAATAEEAGGAPHWTYAGAADGPGAWGRPQPRVRHVQHGRAAVPHQHQRHQPDRADGHHLCLRSHRPARHQQRAHDPGQRGSR